MEDQDLIRREILEAVKLLREHLESIRINMEILEVLKLKGRISLTDKQFIEITELDQKHRRTFQDFVLNELPVMLETNQGGKNSDPMRSFLEWTGDLHISMQYLDRIIKDYLHAINLKDAGGKRSIKNMEVKDKRFWKFLDKMRTKPKMFESFEEPSETEDLHQPADPEEDE
ncbi:MAG: hypothetical protein V2A67_10480 [Bacteroidota bacterium]